MQNERTETIDREYGFDTEEFQRQMVEGLGEWLHRRERRAACVRHIVAVLLVVGSCIGYVSAQAARSGMYVHGDMTSQQVTDTVHNILQSICIGE